LTNVSTNVVGMNWSQVETEDFPVLIANLRGAGCPEYVIRGLVIGRLEESYRDKRRIVAVWPELEPWVGLERRRELGKVIRTAEWSQEDKLSARVQELLGIPYAPEMYRLWREEGIVQIFFGFLSDEKTLRVIMAGGKAMFAGKRIEEESDRILIPDDLRRMAAIGDNFVAECQQRLEPSEANELRLRAQAVFITETCRPLKAVDLSGADLRRICEVSFVLRDAVKEVFMHNGKDDYLTDEEKAQRQAAFDQKLATVLNPVQLQEYQLGAQDDYQATVEFTRKNQLPRMAAEKVTRAFSDAREQAADIRKDKSLTEEEQRAALAVLGATLKNNIHSTLGAHADAFLEQHGELLNELVPLTPTKSP
jgi:hypothetical protein